MVLACGNGEVAPFMGHNACMRWKALLDATFVDQEDGKRKIWSENNVWEDFDMYGCSDGLRTRKETSKKA